MYGRKCEVNSCKAPSQEYVADTFGTPVHIQPNYDDFSCVWKFGVQPPPLAEDEAVRRAEWTASTRRSAARRSPRRRKIAEFGVDEEAIPPKLKGLIEAALK